VMLILLGIGLMTAEAFAPSFGILGIGGLASFAFGAAILVDTDVPEFTIDWPIIAALGVFSLAIIILVGRLALQTRRARVQTGRDDLIGAVGEVMDWRKGTGHVFVRSERWNARGPVSLAKGALVVVQELDGLCLEVAPAPDRPPEP
jgi:membrane-bound serine protease (ClpP class)